MDHPAHALTDVAMLAGALILGAALAEVLGAANMGTALAFGTMGFTATLVWILARR